MDTEYLPLAPADGDSLADFLVGGSWPFHGAPTPDRDTIRQRVLEGHYDGAGSRTYWIVESGERVGLVRLFDLADVSDGGTPLFDLRIAPARRGRGLGRRALTWLTRHLFTEFPDLRRIEGTTRQDNHPMRRVLRSCGYVKEAHHREAWPGAQGQVHDAVGYAITRRDWLSGTVTPPDWDDEESSAGASGAR
ncbi:GNAT family N-acetyltransferase [Streptomyces sp. TP-A0874]|uniref:GNAT family N-acetyltransferase n=1 Tax=Streptomyces sp. TP-A0874 TaxID=549819 RepID=UPI0008530ED6|nr:GNAT family protein [Streptomyces sp. TP-A0874]